MPRALNYELGVPSEKTLPEFMCRNSLEKIRGRVQKLTYVDSRDVDAIVKEKTRLVEFGEAYDYAAGGKAVYILSYFRSIANIFDLEFFTNKLASSANTIANVEKMVLSGVPFWEEGDEALFGDLDDEEESEDDA
jgi:hypothetical protein